jgi:hypothetical protein
MQRRKGLVAFAALSAFLLSGASSPTTCSNSNSNTNNNIPGTNITPGQATAILVGSAAAIAVGTIVLVEVHKSHHTVKGCVTAGPDGLQVHNQGDQKVYALTGLTASVKVGDIVKLNGNKEKNQKDSAGDVDFMIQKISRDYGPCKAALAAPPAAPAANSGQ